MARAKRNRRGAWVLRRRCPGQALVNLGELQLSLQVLG